MQGQQQVVVVMVWVCTEDSKRQAVGLEVPLASGSRPVLVTMCLRTAAGKG